MNVMKKHRGSVGSTGRAPVGFPSNVAWLSLLLPRILQLTQLLASCCGNEMLFDSAKTPNLESSVCEKVIHVRRLTPQVLNAKTSALIPKVV